MCVDEERATYHVCDDIRRCPTRSLEGENLTVLKKIGIICISGASYGGTEAKTSGGVQGLSPLALEAGDPECHPSASISFGVLLLYLNPGCIHAAASSPNLSLGTLLDVYKRDIITRTMRSFVLGPCLVYAARLVHAGPFSFPLPNGFPFPSEAALEDLYTTAGGNFTNMPLAPKFDGDALTSWKLQAFNEFMEVAFFTQLIANITNHVSGYELEQETEDYILQSLRTIQAVSRRSPP